MLPRNARPIPATVRAEDNQICLVLTSFGQNLGHRQSDVNDAMTGRVPDVSRKPVQLSRGFVPDLILKANRDISEIGNRRIGMSNMKQCQFRSEILAKSNRVRQCLG
jgi:hypothetical protein